MNSFQQSSKSSIPLGDFRAPTPILRQAPRLGKIARSRSDPAKRSLDLARLYFFCLTLGWVGLGCLGLSEAEQPLLASREQVEVLRGEAGENLTRFRLSPVEARDLRRGAQKIEGLSLEVSVENLSDRELLLDSQKCFLVDGGGRMNPCQEVLQKGAKRTFARIPGKSTQKVQFRFQDSERLEKSGSLDFHWGAQLGGRAFLLSQKISRSTPKLTPRRALF